MAMDSSDSLRDDFDFDFEEFEITEFDGALLRDLLQESENKDVHENIVDIIQPFEVKNDCKANGAREDCLEQNYDLFQEVEAVMEMNPTLPDQEMIACYVDDIVGMVEFGCFGDASQLYHEDFIDGSLWQD